MEYKFMTREELEYMMMDLHVICLMKDEEIKTLKESINDLNNELEKIINENEQLRKDNNEAVLSLAKEKAELKDLLVDKEKQIRHWRHYYTILFKQSKTEQVKENEQLKKQIDELTYENSELGKFNIHMYMQEREKLMKENRHLKKQIDELISIRYDLEDELSLIKYDFDNLNISLKKAIDEKMAMIEEIKIYIDTIKKLEAVEKNNPPVMDDTDCDSSELPYRADTESKPKFDDSVDCRPRKQ